MVPYNEIPYPSLFTSLRFSLFRSFVIITIRHFASLALCPNENDGGEFDLQNFFLFFISRWREIYWLSSRSVVRLSEWVSLSMSSSWFFLFLHSRVDINYPWRYYDSMSFLSFSFSLASFYYVAISFTKPNVLPFRDFDREDSKKKLMRHFLMFLLPSKFLSSPTYNQQSVKRKKISSSLNKRIRCRQPLPPSSSNKKRN